MIKFEIRADDAESAKTILDKLQAAIADTPEFSVDIPASDRPAILYRSQEDKIILMVGRRAIAPNSDIFLGLSVGLNPLIQHVEPDPQLNLPLDENEDKQIPIPYPEENDSNEFEEEVEDDYEEDLDEEEVEEDD